MSRRPFLLLVLVAACAPAPVTPPSKQSSGAPPSADSSGVVGAPVDKRALMPEPPHARDPWQAPEGDFTPGLVTAVERLFAQGLADPRGLAYREIGVVTGDVWQGGGDVTTTHGWVLPPSDHVFRVMTRAGEVPAQGYAVAWNGLVYPLAALGGAADVASDVRTALQKDADERAKWARDHPGSTFYRFRHALAEHAAVSFDDLAPLRVALLLRLREGKLAAESWQAWSAGMRAHTNDDDVHLRDPYLMFATDFAWGYFDRGLTAHMRGDDALALASFRPLGALAPAVEATADERGFVRRDSGGGAPGSNDAAKAPHLDFLAPLAALVSDSERRVAAGPQLELDLGALAARAPAERVAALVVALERVAARQWGQPGGVSLAEDPIVAALMREGESAVEPLLAVLEDDMRLTRSVHFWRDFARQRSPIGVHEAAYVALAGILQSSFFDAASTGDDLSARGLAGRKAVAEKIRAYWNQWRGVTREERWYRALADDQADQAAWLEAATHLVTPSNVAVLPSSTVFQTTVTTPGAPATLAGEPLRSKAAPSVAELLVKRIPSVDLATGCALASALATWDARAGKVALSAFVGRAVRAPDAGVVARCIAELSVARAQAGDAQALGDYAAYVGILAAAAAGPSDAPWGSGDAVEYEPLWRYPSDPAIAAAAARLFAPGTKWLEDGYHASELCRTSIVRVAAFQKLLLAKLADRRPIGHVKVGDGDFEMTLADGGSQSSMLLESDPLRPPPGTEGPLRTSDFFATLLVGQPNAPRFAPYWPERERERALAAMVAYLATLH